MSWSVSDLPSLTGTTAVVTGANSGIGWWTALELARHGADVTLACRSVEKAEAAAARMRGQLDDRAGTLHVARLDLGSLDSVREFAEGWQGPLGLLVNNAGVMTPPRYQETSDGFELQFGTNHLGHFALTGRLLPSLLAAPASRVVTVSSIAHHGGRGSLLEGNPREHYRPSPAYSNAKLANLLFAFELQRRASLAGAGLTSTAAHPGVCVTNLVSSEQGLGSIPGVRQLWPYVGRVLLPSARAGAEPTLYAATEATPGSYSGPQSMRESRGKVGPAKAQPLARDESLAGKLWSLSEDLTDVRYDWEFHASA
ncbi:MAG: SDR family NAD(P)-dependent oxidoreductase [Nocardioidaceae bacterium]|nr:SDR family NAD(P)-dependent oxidoreductase [Nocardioidaceae bacterium]NUS50994.1 SDR family NAD(P)-dependent oxidoreductase [Nocardioidaceae bacterium]